MEITETEIIEAAIAGTTISAEAEAEAEKALTQVAEAITTKLSGKRRID